MSKSEKHELTVSEPRFELDADQYNKVSCSALLREIKLIGSSYSLKPEVIGLLNDPESLDLSYGGICSFVNFDVEDGIAVGKFEWTAEIKDGRKKCLKLKAEYLLVYSGFSDCEQNHVNYFFSKVGRFATYPYFRSHFSHHISESGLTMAPLPTLRERVD